MTRGDGLPIDVLRKRSSGGRAMLHRHGFLRSSVVLLPQQVKKLSAVVVIADRTVCRSIID